MKKKGWLVAFVAMLMLLSLGVTACKDKTPAPGPDVPPSPAPTVTLDVTEGRLDLYDTLQLTATTANTDQAVSWSTSDARIATVTGGLVTGVGTGTATITATAGEASATCTVVVYNSYTAPVLEIDHERVAVAKNGAFTVTLTTLWKGEPLTESVAYTWTLVEEQPDTVAEIATSGSTATFTGKEYGETAYYVHANVRGTDLVKKVIVKCCNTDITFAIDNLTPGAFAYDARLALIATADDIHEVTPEVAVYNQNVLVPDATVEWVSDDPAVVKVEAGKLIAVSEGTVEVRGAYNNNDVVIRVEAYRPVIRMADKVYFETYKLLPKKQGVATTEGAVDGITLDTEFAGAVTGAKLGDVEIYQSFDTTGKVLTIDKTKLPTEKSKMGDTTFTVDTDLAIYTADAAVVTMAIRSADDLDAFGAVAADQTTDWMNDKTGTKKPYHWDGYFVLAGDIEYNKRFDAFITYGTLGNIGVHNPDQKTESWNSGKANGFQGIFDGQGHTIAGMEMNCWAGAFIGIMAIGSEVKNVSFTDAKNTGNNGFLCAAGIGLIENVYIQCSNQVGGAANNDKNGLIYSSDVMAGAVVKNVFIHTAVTPGNDIYGIGSVHEGYGIYQGVYCVGTAQGARILSTGGGTRNVTGSYATYNDLAQADINFNDWDNDFWRLVNGIPYPKNLTVPTVSTAATLSGSHVAGGSFVTVTTDKRAVVTLDNLPLAMGVTFAGGKLSVPEGVPTGTEIGFTVSSAFDATASARYAVTVLDNASYSIDDITLNVANLGETFTVDLSEVQDDVAGELISVTVDGDVFSSATYNNGILTLDKATLRSHFGDCAFVATFEVKNGETVVGYISVNFNAKVYTMVITTEEQLNRFIVDGYGLTGNANKSDGLYVLDNDITCTGTHPSNFKSGLGDSRNDSGFWGTFDGQGHTIYNMDVSGTDCNFVYMLGKGGVIKNVSFVNAKLNARGGFIVNSGAGTLENVYIQIAVTPQGGEWGNATAVIAGDVYGDFRVKKVLIEYIDPIKAQSTGYAFWNMHRNYGIAAGGLYVVGADKVNYRDGETGGEGADVIGAYADYTALKNANVFGGWSNDFWTVADGVAIPKKLINTGTVTITNTVTALGVDSTVQITGTGLYRTYAVDAAATEAGITIDGYGKLTIPDGDGGVTFTVTVTSLANADATATKTFSTVGNTVVDVTGRQDVAFKGDGDTFTIDLSGESIEGSVQSAKIGTHDFTTVEYADGTLTLDRATLKAVSGEQTIVAIFHKMNGEQVARITTVNIPVYAVTMVITTEAQLNSFVNDGYGLNGDTLRSEGLYVLGGDITCAGQYPSNYREGFSLKSGGFCGTFDGRGHVIYNMDMSCTNSGFVYRLGLDGVIKNVSFVNAKLNTPGGFISTEGGGTVENVFIQIDAAPRVGSGWPGHSATITGDAFGEYRVKKVLIEYINPIKEQEAAYPFYNLHRNYGIAAGGVYAVGADKMNARDGDTGSTPDVMGAYADYTALKNANVFGGWENDFWTVVDGVAVPKALSGKVAVTIANTETTLGVGSTLQITGTGLYRTYAVDAAATAAGITIDGYGLLTIPEGEGGVTFTVTVSSFAATTPATKTFSTVGNTVVNVTGRQDVECKGDGDTFTIDLSAYNVEGAVQGVTIGSAAFTTKSYASGTLTLDRATLDKARGEQTIVAIIHKMNGDQVAQITTVNIPVMSVTKVIRTVEDFQTWHTVAKTLATEAWYYDGYFVLGNDLEFNDTVYEAYWTWSIANGLGKGAGNVWNNGYEVGFRGTFDGRGHKIDKLRFSGWSGSLFGILTDTAVIKNIVLNDYRNNGGGGAITSGGLGRIENVYVYCTAQNDGNDNDKTAFLVSHDCMAAMRVVNCFVKMQYAAGENTYALGKFHEGYGIVKNAYCVGDTKGILTISTGGGERNVYGAYATVEDMKAANIAITAENGWDMDFWTTDADGLPIPKTLAA